MLLETTGLTLEEIMDDTLLTIGEMCAKYDVTPRTLRFYEAKELLFPQRDGTRRLFGKSCQARLKLILRGKRFGFALEEIRQLLNLYDADDSQRTQLQRTYDLGLGHYRTMIAQRDELNEAISEFDDQLTWVKSVLNNNPAKAAE